MALNTRALVLAGALAGTTIFASPAAAAQLPATGFGASSAVFDASRYDPDASTADWRCRGYGCGYGRRGYRRGYRRGVSAGDVLIGAAIIGGIAAIANSNNRRQRDRDVVIVERDVRDNDYNPRFEERRDDRRDDRRDNDRSRPRGTGSAGIDSAVDQCLARIERDVRVDTVDNVERTGAGWRVSGTLFNGTPFQCRIGNGGQIDGIDYSSFSGAPSVPYLGIEQNGTSPRAESVPYLGKEQAQWSDQRYADARARLNQPAPSAVPADQPLPAYPGGPIPGEEIPETIDSDV